MESKAPKGFVAAKRAMEADVHEADDQQGSTHKKIKSDPNFTQGYSAVAQRIMVNRTAIMLLLSSTNFV